MNQPILGNNARPFSLGVLLSLALSGCTFLDLSSDLDAVSCTDKAADFCEDLNELRPTDDACMRWSCDPVLDLCSIRPRDNDGDGAPAMECAPDGVEPDCDDEDGTRAPTLDETCDGQDNDCDAFADEGIYDSNNAVLVQQAVQGGDARDLSLATELEAPSLTLAYTADRTPSANLGVSFLGELSSAASPGGDVKRGGTPVASRIRGTAIAPMSGGHVISYVPVGANERMSVGLIKSGSGLVMGGATELDHPQDCTAGVRTPAIAVQGLDATVAFVCEQPDPEEICVTTSPAAVSVTTAELPTAGAETLDAGPDSEQAGTTVDVGSPALVHGDSFGTLLAYADATKTGVRVMRVDVDSNDNVSLSEVFHQPGPSTTGQVRLAIGPLDGETQSFALAWREGCARDARVKARLFAIDTTTGDAVVGELETAIDGEETDDATASQVFPAIVWQPTATEWLFAWRDGGRGIRAIRLTPRGEAIGEPFDGLDDKGSLTNRIFVKALPEGLGYGAVTYVSGDNEPGFWSVEFSCSAN